MMLTTLRWLGWLVAWALLALVPAGPLWAATPVDTAPLSIPVLKSPLPKGALVEAAMLRDAAIPASRVFASTLVNRADIVGLQALRPLPAGVPLSRLHLRPQPTISRGATVPFVLQRGSLTLRGHGTALHDGAVGQSLRLLNPDTRATLVGTVGADGQVTIN